MKLDRRYFVAGGTLAVASPFVIRQARAAEFDLRFANNLQLTHPLNVRLKEAADRIKNETSGKVDLQIFPSSQLGSDTDTLGQVRSGAVDFFSLSGLILSTLVPAAAISGLGFAFKDYPSVWAAMDGKLGDYIRGEIGKSRQIFAFDTIWDNGFRQMTSSTKPFTSAKDLEGFKIRVPPSPLWTSMFKAFGSAPVSINFNEVYSSLQTKVIDGQENPLAIIETAKLYEVQSFCSITNHMWDGFWILGNRRKFDALPKDIQAIIAKNLNSSGIQERADVEKLNAGLQEELGKKSMKFNTVDASSFRQKLSSAGFYAEWKGKFGDEAWAILEAAVGKLG